MVNRQVSILLAVAVLASVCLTPLTVRADSITPIALADPPGFFVLKPIGTPMGTGVLNIDVTFFVNGQKVSGKVTIDKGAIVPFQMPAFDPILNVLSLDKPIPDGATLIWGNTDEGLEFATEFDAVASETSSLELLGIGFVLMVLILRRRSAK